MGSLREARHAAGIIGPIIAASGFDREDAEAISPRIPTCRLKHRLPLTPWSATPFWGGDEHGYTDFPALEPAAA